MVLIFTNHASGKIRKKISLFWVFFLTVWLSGVSCDPNSNGGSNPPVPPPSAHTFTNPLLSSGPDPWIIKKDNIYYYTHTLGNRIALWKTTKVSELKNALVQTIWTAPTAGANAKNVWAPELHYLDNKWYMYYTAGSGDLSTQRTFVLENTSADPLNGTWTDKGQIGDPAANVFAIDATVFSYNGKNYFLWSGQASEADKTQRIYIARMTNPWTLETSRSLISSPQYSWEMVGAPPSVNEGPECLKSPAGKVFLVFSASGCWTDDYALGMLTLKEGGDPLKAEDWTKSPAPVFSKEATSSAFSPGHNSFFKSVDGTEDWILYHANSQSGQACGDNRNPRMQKITWNADGTPNFGKPAAINTAITRPSGE
jgi:GH43 family beta-xylosidase